MKDFYYSERLCRTIYYWRIPMMFEWKSAGCIAADSWAPTRSFLVSFKVHNIQYFFSNYYWFHLVFYMNWFLNVLPIQKFFSWTKSIFLIKLWTNLLLIIQFIWTWKMLIEYLDENLNFSWFTNKMWLNRFVLSITLHQSIDIGTYF